MNYIILVLWFLCGWLGWALLRWDWSNQFKQSYWCLTPKQYIGVFFMGFPGILLLFTAAVALLFTLFCDNPNPPGKFRQWLNKPVCR